MHADTNAGFAGLCSCSEMVADVPRLLGAIVFRPVTLRPKASALKSQTVRCRYAVENQQSHRPDLEMAGRG